MKIPIHSFYCIILLCALILTCSVASAQNQRKLNGLVLDSLKEAVPGADVYIIADKDTLNTITDNNGKFSFTGFGASRISLLIMSVGFRPYHKSFSYKTDELVMVLDPISLVPESKLLNEVIISNKDLPIRIKKDTIEYNASFYQTSENDRVEDLLRLLPGVEIDAAGNVTTMGKPLLKLRVNGEDFFTSSVKDFMNQLPANVIDKLQIINDYGDEANFTGIKSGEPQKMLNLVTKEGQNKGTFGNIASSGGTNDRYGLALNGNLWQGSKQVGVNASSNNTNNEAGINTSATTGISYRDKLANGLTASAGYSYAYNKNLSRQLNFIETINPRGGTIFNRSESASNAEDNN
ncbi:MAG: carboxypeptidase-like regulatory domain-containing protein, partial [Pedobacter sp.]|nr:carboxypeptidase-like regulatory domain-containing protein [Pedobacter sp.]